MFDVVPVILLLPIAGFAILTFAGRRLGDPEAGWLATAAVFGSFVCSLIALAGLLSRNPANRTIVQTYYSWIPVGSFRVDVGTQLDPLSMTMVLFVTGVSSLIHLYSIGYMKGDPQFRKFFVYLNLFVASMLILVLGDNLLFTFVGWEGVGTCSYLLVGFWFDRRTAATAAKKAFVVNRVGDFGFLLAMFLLFQHLGTLSYTGMFSHLGGLTKTTATAASLLLLLGAVGKSAQLPLWVWLPDAMEGPTPVSALIHAATMVTAGVYLMTRVSPILHLSPVSLTIIAALGAATAFVAATVACAQNDIKRVLAYSTVSQLGYMFLGVGCTAYGAAVFHMVAHAFFKALLFLGAGAIIHALHDEQDMKRMGGLGRFLPVTTPTYVVAWLAISGIPPLVGFWSKDQILGAAWATNRALWAVGVVTVLLTAYYMTRQMILVFTGQSRWDSAGGAGHAGAGAHATRSLHPHEGPWVMRFPLIALAIATVLGGLLDLPFNGLNYLDKFLEPVVGRQTDLAIQHQGVKAGLMVASVVMALLGMAAARGLWWNRVERPALEPLFLESNWHADDVYSAIFYRAGGALSRFLNADIDNRVVDGAVNGVATLARRSGAVLRRTQTGYVRNYALGIGIGLVAILGFLVSRASL